MCEREYSRPDSLPMNHTLSLECRSKAHAVQRLQSISRYWPHAHNVDRTPGDSMFERRADFHHNCLLRSKSLAHLYLTFSPTRSGRPARFFSISSVKFCTNRKCSSLSVPSIHILRVVPLVRCVRGLSLYRHRSSGAAIFGRK